MKSRAVGSTIGGLSLAVILAIGACRSSATPADVPPVTSASPNAAIPVMSDGNDAGASSSPPPPTVSTAPAGAAEVARPVALLRDAPFRIEDGACTRVLVAVANGSFTVEGEKLSAGDVIVLTHPEASEVKGSGLAVEARANISPSQCVVKTRPAPEKTVVRANAAAKLEWAGGKMSARLDVGTKLSPKIYLGRLEGTGAVAEHTHPSSWEIVVSIEAAGTFTLEGKEHRLGPRQIVAVPPGAKHAWKPDPGAKLVAIQMYSPPGPEQRLIALAQAEAASKDAGSR